MRQFLRQVHAINLVKKKFTCWEQENLKLLVRHIRIFMRELLEESPFDYWPRSKRVSFNTCKLYTPWNQQPVTSGHINTIHKKLTSSKMKSSRQDFFSIANIIAETKTSATAEVNPINKGKDDNSNQS